MKFRVAHKGLLLIGVPLVMELILCGALFILLEQSHLAGQRAQHARDVVECLQTMESEATKIGAMIDEGRSGAERAKIEGFKMKEQMQKMHRLVKDDPRYADFLVEMDRANKAIIDMYEELMPLYMQNRVFELATRVAKYRHVYLDLRDKQRKLAKIDYLLRIESTDLDVETARQTSLRQRTKMLLYVALILSLVIGVFLAIFISRQITGRLNVIIANNKRLLAGEKLLPVVPGSDEITELDRAFHDMHRVLRIAQRREEAVQQLRDRAVSMVTQNLRKPLSSVAVFFTRIESADLEPETQNLRSVAGRNLNRMERLIEDLDELEHLSAKTISLSKTTFDLSTAISGAKEMVAAASAGRNVSIVAQGDEVVEADERRITQVIANLLGNAIKYSPENSTVEVSTTRTKTTVSVHIKDHGRGIQQEVQESIFKPFQQAKSTDAAEFGGFGLGLAICRQIIEAHSGELSVASKEGEGSTFTFTLPRTVPSI